MRYVLGLDIGGSKLEISLKAQDGNELTTYSAKSMETADVGWNPTAHRAEVAIHELLGGHQLESIVALTAGIAGAESNLSQRRWSETLSRVVSNAEIQVVPDYELPLATLRGAGGRVAAIAGTGSVAVGRHADRTVRADGWGWLFGDEGSGMATGLRGVRAVLRSADGRGPSTSLGEAALHHFQIADLHALPSLASDRLVPLSKVSTFAEVVCAHAEAEDRVAQSIVARSALAICESIEAVVTQLGTNDYELALAGGLMRCDLLRNSVVAELDQRPCPPRRLTLATHLSRVAAEMAAQQIQNPAEEGDVYKGI